MADPTDHPLQDLDALGSLDRILVYLHGVAPAPRTTTAIQQHCSLAPHSLPGLLSLLVTEGAIVPVADGQWQAVIGAPRALLRGLRASLREEA
jgi:hypothetical protein